MKRVRAREKDTHGQGCREKVKGAEVGRDVGGRENVERDAHTDNAGFRK